MSHALVRLAALTTAAAALAGAPPREHAGFDRHDRAARAMAPIKLVAGAAKGGGLLAGVDAAGSEARRA